MSQALSSVDIGSLICNVGAGGGAPAGAPAAGAPASAGEAPGNVHIYRCKTKQPCRDWLSCDILKRLLDVSLYIHVWNVSVFVSINPLPDVSVIFVFKLVIVFALQPRRRRRKRRRRKSLRSLTMTWALASSIKTAFVTKCNKSAETICLSHILLLLSSGTDVSLYNKEHLVYWESASHCATYTILRSVLYPLIKESVTFVYCSSHLQSNPAFWGI